MQSERKRSFLRSSSGSIQPTPTPTPTPTPNPTPKLASSSSVSNMGSAKPTTRKSGFNIPIPAITEIAGTDTIVGNSQELPDAKDSAPMAESIPSLDLPSVLIEAHADMPSISPRDKLSYIEDKKAWKDIKQYEQNLAALNILVGEIEAAVLQSKPDDIPGFIVDQFFSERNLIEIRKEIEERSKYLV